MWAYGGCLYCMPRSLLLVNSCVLPQVKQLEAPAALLLQHAVGNFGGVVSTKLNQWWAINRAMRMKQPG